MSCAATGQPVQEKAENSRVAPGEKKTNRLEDLRARRRGDPNRAAYINHLLPHYMRYCDYLCNTPKSGIALRQLNVCTRTPSCLMKSSGYRRDKVTNGTIPRHRARAIKPVSGPGGREFFIREHLPIKNRADADAR